MVVEPLKNLHEFQKIAEFLKCVRRKMSNTPLYTIRMGLANSALDQLADLGVNIEDDQAIWMYFEKEMPKIAEVGREVILSSLRQLVFGKGDINGPVATRRFESELRGILEKPRKIIVEYAKNFGRGTRGIGE